MNVSSRYFSYLPRNSFSQIIRLKSTLLRTLSDDRLRVPLKRSLAQFSKRDPLIIRRLPALVFFRTRVFNKLVLMRLPCSSLWFLISIYSLRDWVSILQSLYLQRLFTVVVYSRLFESEKSRSSLSNNKNQHLRKFLIETIL